MRRPASGGRSVKAKVKRRVPVATIIDPDAFRLARGRGVLSREEAAGFLGVSERTIRNWEEGRSKIPYAAFKLLRCYSGFELPHPSWQGFTFHKETLWSPDLRAYRADDLANLGLILAMARYWHEDYKRRRPALPGERPPSSNVLQFPRERGAAGPAVPGLAKNDPGQVRPEPAWPLGLVRKWFG